MRSILATMALLGAMATTVSYGWADDGHRLQAVGKHQEAECKIEGVLEFKVSADGKSLEAYDGAGKLYSTITLEEIIGLNGNPRRIVVLEQGCMNPLDAALVEKLKAKAESAPKKEEVKPVKTKTSSTGDVWKLAGTNEAGEEFWEEPETGFIYSPKISAEIIKNFTEKNKIYIEGSTRFDYSAGAQKYCESRNDLGKKWTTPSGVHHSQDAKNKADIDKQFNVAESHGIRSILDINNGDWLWSRSPSPDYRFYGLSFGGSVGRVIDDGRVDDVNGAVCVSVGGGS